MICRACRSAFVADAISAQRLLLRASQRQLLTAASSRAPVLLRQSRVPQYLTSVARAHLFSTSTPRPTAPAQAEGAAPASGPGLEKPTYLSEGESEIWDILVAEFAPAELLVQDISGGCGSMYGIEISSDKFRGLNMLKQQRLVNAALGDLVKQWHGVQLKTRVP